MKESHHSKGLGGWGERGASVQRILRGKESSIQQCWGVAVRVTTEAMVGAQMGCVSAVLSVAGVQHSSQVSVKDNL